MNILNRMKNPTPTFFKKIRNVGVSLAAISGALLASPVALPAVLIKIAGHLAVAGVVATTISQSVVTNEEQ
jgi:hypothetical protein